jgi:flagellin-like protein
MRNKKGLSPVIATVLLIAIVVVIALILFLWFRGMVKESITKFGGENIQLVCDRVQFDADYTNGMFYISNTGNVPIYSLSLEVSEDKGAYESNSIRDITNPAWPNLGLNQGQSYSGGITLTGSITKIKIIPILMGSSEQGQKTYLCDKSTSIKEIIL